MLFVAGYSDGAVGHRGALDAKNAFLEKPFSPHALTRKVREVLDDALEESVTVSERIRNSEDGRLFVCGEDFTHDV